MEFIIESLCGIKAVEPGYRQILFASHPYEEIKDIRAEFDGPSGKIISGYRMEDTQIVYEFLVPDGAKAMLRLPGENPMPIPPGYHEIRRSR